MIVIHDTPTWSHNEIKIKLKSRNSSNFIGGKVLLLPHSDNGLQKVLLSLFRSCKVEHCWKPIKTSFIRMSRLYNDSDI